MENPMIEEYMNEAEAKGFDQKTFTLAEIFETIDRSLTDFVREHAPLDPAMVEEMATTIATDFMLFSDGE